MAAGDFNPLNADSKGKYTVTKGGRFDISIK
jgi:hypothetical protein